jgi:ribulose-bisphosphate carboxylase large chain
VARANRESGLRCVYMPNVTGPVDRVVERALFAKEQGAGALLICPGLTGLDTMRGLADDPRIDLPLMSHPAFYGGSVLGSENGISHYALYGQLQRLAGADASIYPTFGGRFSFSRGECGHILDGCTDTMGDLRPIFPTPGGGMSLSSIPEMRSLYGSDVIYLIGGGLHQHGDDLVEATRTFVRLIEA